MAAKIDKLDWYISNIHVDHALSFLYHTLRDDGLLVLDLPEDLFKTRWKEALKETEDAQPASPIGPDQDDARKFLMAGIEARLEVIEEREDNIETAIETLINWLRSNITSFGRLDHHKVRDTLYGTQRAPKASSG